MKRILFVLGLLFSMGAFSQNITVVQINADWNSSNTRTDLADLKGCSYKFGWLDEQSAAVQAKVSSVPTVIIYKDNKPVKVYSADISLRLDVSFAEIQKKVWAIKQE